MSHLWETFCSGPKAIAQLLTVYIAEAHATDEWYIEGMPAITQHKSIEERILAAKHFAEQLTDSCLIDTIVVDSFEDTIKEVYESWPERLYAIRSGSIAYKGGPGPFEYSPSELKEFLLQVEQSTLTT